MKKKLLPLLVVLSIVLTGCGDSAEIDMLNSIQALNSESDLSENYRLSYTDEQSMIYSQVSDRNLLDLSTLSACSEDELQQVINYMDSVDAQLTGSISGSDDIIASCFTNYLLAEFQNTPYYWQRTNMTIRGIDAESRSIVVDVKYKTIGFQKDVIPESLLVLGEPAYDQKLKVRYQRWMQIMQTKYNNYQSIDWQSAYNDFVTIYGDPQQIYDAQSNMTLTQEIFETGNQRTYENMIDSDAEQSGGTMTVRYVLVPNYVLGINLGITCQHMYITEFKLDNDITSGMQLFTNEGYDTVTDSVYDLIYRYFQCLDENDFRGLYKLTADFGKIDRHYQDVFNTTFMKHENFTVSLFDIQGTHIKCGVTVADKVRAKGSNMTFPSYTDRYYMELELLDGVLQVQNMVLLSRTIDGEPAITTDDADVNGFSTTIDLDNDDRIAIENLICDFSAMQLAGMDSNSPEFGQIVDLSMSEADLKTLSDNMKSHSGSQKVVWISNYQQGTSNYASVRCKELYQQSDNSINEVQCVYEFILKGGKWYVYGYRVTQSVRLDTTNLATTGSLCLIQPGNVVSYTSQVRGTASTSTETVSDVSESYDYAEYMPSLKSGSTEQGYNQTEGYNLSSSDYSDYFERLMSSSGNDITEDGFNNLLAALDTDIMSITSSLAQSSNASEEDEEGEESEEYIDNSDLISTLASVESPDAIMDELVAIMYNSVNNRYTGNEIVTVIEELDARIDETISAYSAISSYAEDSQSYSRSINQLDNIFGNCTSALKRTANN